MAISSLMVISKFRKQNNFRFDISCGPEKVSILNTSHRIKNRCTIVKLKGDKSHPDLGSDGSFRNPLLELSCNLA